jgi:ankyrin repeat protein
VRLLLESGARVNAGLLYDGRTALHIVCGAEYDQYRFLYEEDAEYKKGPAHFDSNVIKCIEILLEHGAEVDIRAAEEESAPLHVACGECIHYQLIPEPRRVRILLENGANVGAARRDGRTALHLLCGADGSDFEGRLFRFNSSVIECVEVLLGHGAEVDVGDDEGDVPFVLACETGKLEVADLLLAHHH